MRDSFWIVACVLAAAASACSDSSNPVEPSASAVAATLPDEMSRTEQPNVGLRADLAAARRATAAFHDPAVAAAAGYLFNEPCQQSASGAMGIHAPNPALVRDGIVNQDQPEILLYLPQDDGSLRLVGVEYMQLVTVRNLTTGIAAPWRSPSPWPADYELVTPTPELFGQIFQGPMAGHTATMPWHWDLHVWLWAHNPDGMFAPWNPTLQCPQ